MQQEYCEFCFKTIDTDVGQAIRCLSCSRTYHKEHFDGACHYCSGTATESHVSTPRNAVRNVVRKPARLKRIDPDDSRWGLGDYVAWLESLAWASIYVILGIVVSTVIGAYTFRLLNYNAYQEPVAYLNSIIRSDFPSADLFYGALMASVLGALVFFPSKLPTRTQPHSSDRRLWRFMSILILLIGINFVLLGLDINDFVQILSSELQIIIGIAGHSFLAAQGGALATTMLIGFTIRSRNESVYDWEFPKLLRQATDVVGVLKSYVASLATVAMAWLLTISLLPEYRLTVITIEIGEWAIQTNRAHMTALTSAVFVALLLYHPPDHSKAKRKWWLFRFVGCGIILATFANFYRAAGLSELDALMQAAIIAVILATCFVPVQRTFS